MFGVKGRRLRPTKGLAWAALTALSTGVSCNLVLGLDEDRELGDDGAGGAAGAGGSSSIGGTPAAGGATEGSGSAGSAGGGGLSTGGGGAMGEISGGSTSTGGSMGGGGSISTGGFGGTFDCQSFAPHDASVDQHWAHPSLAYHSGAQNWGVSWGYWSSQIAYDRLDATGTLITTASDSLPVTTSSGVSRGDAAIAPLLDSFVIAYGDQEASTITPRLVRVTPASGAAEAGPGAGAVGADTNLPYVEGLAVSEGASFAESAVLTVLRTTGPSPGAALVRRFNGETVATGDDDLANTKAADAAYVPDADRFAVVLMTDQGALELRTYPTSGTFNATTHEIGGLADEPTVPSFGTGLAMTAAEGDVFVAWTDARIVGSSRIYLTKVDALTGERGTGTTDSVWVSEATPGTANFAPRLTFDGQLIVVAWLVDSENAIWMRRFAPDLTPVGNAFSATGDVPLVETRFGFARGESNEYGLAFGQSDVFQMLRVVCDGP